MATAMSKKITALKALLGDEAAKKVVEEAASREKAARDAGIEFKENDEAPVKLSSLLDQIDAAIAAGTVVDDVNTEETTEETPVADKQTAPTLDQFKEAVTQIVDAKIAALKDELKPAKTDKEKQEEADKAKQEETEKLKTSIKELTAKLEELTGEQPRNSGFRASRSETTVKEGGQKNPPPGFDPLNTFIDEMVFGAPNSPNGAA